jgi:hypothetical protein
MEKINIAPIDVSKAQEVTIEAQNINTHAGALAIKTQVEYEDASAFLKRIKTKYNEIEATRKSITQPLDQAKKNIMDLFRKPLELLRQAEGVAKRSILTYMDEQERIRREQEEKLAREAEKKRKELEAKAEAAREAGKETKAEQYEEKANNVVAPVLAPTVEQAKGQAVKLQWSAKVIDFAKLPDNYKLPNMPMLNKVAQATKGQVPIPGVEFKSEKILASRT